MRERTIMCACVCIVYSHTRARVSRYDVEQFQRIEALTGQRMEQYSPPEDAVLLLLERTGEAQRIATMQVGRMHASCPNMICCMLALARFEGKAHSWCAVNCWKKASSRQAGPGRYMFLAADGGWRADSFQDLWVFSRCGVIHGGISNPRDFRFWGGAFSRSIQS